MSKSFNKQTHWSSNGNSQDRGFRGHDTRRVSFKSNRHGKKDTKDWTAPIRAHLLDEDIDMSGSSVSFKNKKFPGGGRRNKRPGSPAPNGRRKFLEGPTGWYRVSLLHGDKYDKSFLQTTLLEHLRPLTFWPMAWESVGAHIHFYVDEFKVAEKLHGLDRQIQLPNGFKLSIRVQTASINVDMTPQTKEKIKLVMAKRYNAATKALDLTKFHADPDLQDMTCALYKPTVLFTIIDIIGDNIPELEALNLFDNKISILKCSKSQLKKLCNLKILHIGNNKLRDISQLDILVGLPIVDLLLDGNPLCDKFKDHSSYISEVRKRLPKVMKLDGIDLPPPISFDISEELTLPTPSQTFLCNEEGQRIVRQFLEQYIQIYDSDNRQPLIQAYHENAMFSLTSAYPYGYGKERNGAWLNWYNTDNRNLLRLQDSERRNKLLRQGQVAVVSFLQEMPQTKHDILNFTVDLTLFTPTMLSLTVSGMFKELKSGHKVPPLRYFFKTLIIVPAGSGFCIANEEVHISNATPEQAVYAFKAPTPVEIHPPQVIPAPPIPAIGSPVAPVMPPVPDNATKEEMVKQMTAHSGMNLEWSVKCLEETQWDFFRARAVFDQLQAEGRVPAEAFIK